MGGRSAAGFVEQHGITVTEESLAQNVLTTFFDVEAVKELKEEYTEELAEEGIDELAGCADETYPVKKDAKKEFYEESMDGGSGKPPDQGVHPPMPPVQSTVP